MFKVYNWLIYAQLAYKKIARYRFCFLCDRHLPDVNNGLCVHCKVDFPFNRHCCARCGVKLPVIHNQNLNSNRICGDCLASPPAWHELTALSQYEYPVSTLLPAVKYKAKFSNARLLSSLFISHLRCWLQHPIPECIMPVPLHPARQKQRGFNQAIELARPIATHFDIPLDINTLARTLDTEPQSSLDLSQRQLNLHGAFSIRKKPGYKHIALFDDVVTSGNTVSALCTLLHKHGVQRVDVWCIARASKPD